MKPSIARPSLILAALASATMVSACGQRVTLAYPVGAPGPAIPAGDTAAPTPAELIEPTTQARPKRNDELLRQSEERQSDEYDLPPS